MNDRLLIPKPIFDGILESNDVLQKRPVHVFDQLDRVVDFLSLWDR